LFERPNRREAEPAWEILIRHSYCTPGKDAIVPVQTKPLSRNDETAPTADKTKPIGRC